MAMEGMDVEDVSSAVRHDEQPDVELQTLSLTQGLVTSVEGVEGTGRPMFVRSGRQPSRAATAHERDQEMHPHRR